MSEISYGGFVSEPGTKIFQKYRPLVNRISKDLYLRIKNLLNDLGLA